MFLVASAREGFDPAKVLFEFDGVRRDTAPSRTTEEKTALSFAVRTANTSSNGWGVSPDGPSHTLDSANGQAVVTGYRMVAFGEYTEDETASTMKARDHKDATDLLCSVHGTQDPIVGREIAHALGRNSGQENAVYPINLQIATRHKALGERTGLGIGSSGDPAFTLQAAHSHGVCSGPHIRRLTPIECERLQGFQDNYTLIPWRDRFICNECGEEFTDKHASGAGLEFMAPAECVCCGEEKNVSYNTPDGHRYKALGNSMAVPCMRWIGERIAEYMLS